MRKGLGETVGSHRSPPQVQSHLNSDISEGEDSELGSEFVGELDAGGSGPWVEDDDTGAESDEEDYDEWTGFGQGSEADEDPVPPPAKPQGTAAAIPAPQPGSKYVPPYLRKAAANVQSQSPENLVKLTKQLKGLLNRYAVYLLSLSFTPTDFPV